MCFVCRSLAKLIRALFLNYDVETRDNTAFKSK